ncbi:hypothetical protein ACERK3_02240 [Phycisphaerales bacterium AB-hyl4]|uniref:Transposase n=1 Tax=Natronomicrosphaera hydrolytica TaxID=3242702 RepID=A0ABV4U0H8_9BACT
MIEHATAKRAIVSTSYLRGRRMVLGKARAGQRSLLADLLDAEARAARGYPSTRAGRNQQVEDRKLLDRAQTIRNSVATLEAARKRHNQECEGGRARHLRI